MSKPVNVAIIGAGIGAQHLDGYRELPARFTVERLCDRDVERAKGVVGDDTSIGIESTVDAVLEDPAIDLVDICLPPHLHFETCMAALSAGKHVVCEKPLVTSLCDADTLTAHAEACGRLLTPVFQYRYGRGTSQLRALMDAGLAGKPLVASLETHWNRQSDYYQVPWRGTWAGEQGGAVLGHAIHNHDLLCMIFGPVSQLTAFTETRVNAIEVEDCAAISMKMETGALASSSITLGASDDTTRLRFIFENLTAESGSTPYAPADGDWTFSARGTTSQTDIDACLQDVPPVRSGFAGFFEALADALDGTGGREVTLEDGRRSLELVTVIYHAARTASVVDLPLSASHPLYDGWTPSARMAE